MAKDMTKGSPIKNIISFCLPMTAGSIFQQLYNMVDSIIVGQYVGVKAFSAVGLLGAVCFLVIGTATGMCSGFAIPVAQRFGANDYKGVRRTVCNSAALSAMIAVLLTVATLVFTKPLLRLMSTPDDLMGYAYQYIVIIFAGIPVTIFYNLLSGILRALGDSKTPLKYLLVSSGLNVIFDLCLIIVFKMGVAGAAAATIASQLIAGLLCLRFIIRELPILSFDAGEKTLDPALMKSIFAVGMPMAFQFSITAVGSIILQTAVNKLGSNSVAAMAAGQKIQNFIVQPMESIALALATFGGQNLGANRLDRIHKAVRQTLAISLAYSCAIAAAVFFFGEDLAQIFIKRDSADYALIVAQIRQFLRTLSLFYPILAVLFIFRNLLQGLGFSAVTMLAGCVELVCRIIIAFGFMGRYGFNAAVFASPLSWTAAGVLLIFIYLFEIRRADSAKAARKPVLSR